MSVFRIAHLSDLHFGATADRLNPIDAVNGSLREKSRAAFSHLLKRKLRGGLAEVTYPSTYSTDVAFALLPELDEQLESCDALLVTGDLATTGSDTDLTMARQYFAGALPRSENPLAAPLPALDRDIKRVLFSLPGNHDRYSGTALLPDSRRYEYHFGPSWDFSRNSAHDVLSILGASRVKYCLLRKPQGSALAVVAADFSMDYWLEGEGNFGWVGQGKVVGNVLRDLEATTRQIQMEMEEAGAGNAVVWAIHFPPSFPGIDEKLQLLDSAALVDCAANLGVRLIMTGHTHTPLRYYPHQSVEVLCSGASTGMGHDDCYFYSLVDIRVDNEVTAVRPILRRWDSTEEEFVSVSEYPTHAN